MARSLGLNGIGGVDILAIFKNGPVELRNLHKLALYMDGRAPGGFGQAQLTAVVEACSKLAHLSLDVAAWNVEPVSSLDCIAAPQS